MKRFLLPLLLASVAPAQERVLRYSSTHEMMKEVQPMLDRGWAVKALAYDGRYPVVVISPPKVDPNAPRKILPGGIEERRLKMQATKVEESKP